MRKRAFSILQTLALPLGYRALNKGPELAGNNGARKRRFRPIFLRKQKEEAMKPRRAASDSGFLGFLLQLICSKTIRVICG